MAASAPDAFSEAIAENVGFRWRLLFENQLYVLTVGSLGVLFVLPLLFPARLARLARRHFDRALFVLSVYASLSITNNTERPLAYALPVVVPAALVSLRWLLEDTRLPPGPVLAAAVALQVLFWWNQRWAESGMSIYQPVNWTTLGALALATLAALLLVVRARRAAAAA